MKKVFAAIGNLDLGDAGRTADPSDRVNINARLGEVFEQRSTEYILAYQPDHRDRVAKARDCHGLVCALASRSRFKPASGDRLASHRDARSSRHQVHVDATYDNDRLAVHHLCIVSNPAAEERTRAGAQIGQKARQQRHGA